MFLGGRLFKRRDLWVLDGDFLTVDDLLDLPILQGLNFHEFVGHGLNQIAVLRENLARPFVRFRDEVELARYQAFLETMGAE